MLLLLLKRNLYSNLKECDTVISKIYLVSIFSKIKKCCHWMLSLVVLLYYTHSIIHFSEVIIYYFTVWHCHSWYCGNLQSITAQFKINSLSTIHLYWKQSIHSLCQYQCRICKYTLKAEEWQSQSFKQCSYDYKSQINEVCTK